jgi:hypothetical protein
MNHQTWRTLRWCFGVALVCDGTPLVASAAEWDPGQSTTSVLPGEISTEAPDFGPDGVYGRFDGDLDLALSAGAELESGVERLLVAASAHYYWTAGVYTAYREAVGDDRDTIGFKRLFSVGVDVRPMFIPRWSFDWQTGPATLDLMIDSISASGGAYFAPTETGAGRRGFETTFGAGVPLAAVAAGPWLSVRYDVRFPEAGAPSTSVWIMLSWHVLVSTPLAGNTGASALGARRF